jgi:hypothetical protein
MNEVNRMHQRLTHVSQIARAALTMAGGVR